MTIQVNPPPTLRIPKSFLNDPEIKAFIKQQNAIIFQLYRRSGGTKDITFDNSENIEENTEIINNITNSTFSSNMSAVLQQTIRRLDGLPEFTMDTEGFTMDSTEFTMDKVIA